MINRKRINYRPGPGWKNVYGPVWEHANGIRIHTMGVVRLQDMTFINSFNVLTSMNADMFVRINGGNRKRGIMAWALASSVCGK